MENSVCAIEMSGEADCLWRYVVKATGRRFDIAAPVFEVDGREVTAALSGVFAKGKSTILPNGATEWVFAGTVAGESGLALSIVLRITPDNPVVRFRYRLEASREHRLTKRKGADNLQYLKLSVADLPCCKEIRLSEFNESVHSYGLTEHRHFLKFNHTCPWLRAVEVLYARL